MMVAVKEEGAWWSVGGLRWRVDAAGGGNGVRRWSRSLLLDNLVLLLFLLCCLLIAVIYLHIRPRRREFLH